MRARSMTTASSRNHQLALTWVLVTALAALLSSLTLVELGVTSSIPGRMSGDRSMTWVPRVDRFDAPALATAAMAPDLAFRRSMGWLGDELERQIGPGEAQALRHDAILILGDRVYVGSAERAAAVEVDHDAGSVFVYSL